MLTVLMVPVSYWTWLLHVQQSISIRIITNGHNIAYTEMNLWVKYWLTLIPQINKALAIHVHVGSLDYTCWVFPPVSLTFVVHVEVLLLCHQLAVVLSVILKLQYLNKKTVTTCIHRYSKELTWYSLSRAAISSSIKAERERAAGCWYVVRWGGH